VKYLNCRLQRAMGVCKRKDKVARAVIANDRDGATSGRWDGRQLSGQIDPKPTFIALNLAVTHLNRKRNCVEPQPNCGTGRSNDRDGLPNPSER
jgi:hypothetical protein